TNGARWGPLFFKAICRQFCRDHSYNRFVRSDSNRWFESGLGGRGDKTQRRRFVRTIGVPNLQGSCPFATGTHEFFCLHRHGAIVFAAGRFAAANFVNRCVLLPPPPLLSSPYQPPPSRY